LNAIVSDIHGNLEALNAVLEDIEAHNITDVICLGDVVGYGPNPIECLEIVRKRCKIAVKGNHEEAVISEPVDFNSKAEQAIKWTQEAIRKAHGMQPKLNLDFLQQLPETAKLDEAVLVHGTPRRPTRDYLFPRDIIDFEKMKDIFAQVDTYCFAGHTHIPGVFSADCKYTHPSDLMAGVYILDEEKFIINVGSVGQPRDGDPRASYCTFDGDSVVFRRVKYDFNKTMRKIYAIDSLQNSLGDRLAEGR